jgi:hypothetical protein
MTEFFTTAAAVVIHTPVWVWALYSLLLFLSFQRTRDSTIALWRVLILPLAVALLAISSFVSAGLSALPTMLLGLVIGGAAGWRLEPNGATRRLPGNKLWLRGEWWSLAQIVLVLILRYATNVVPAVNPALNADPTWRLSTLFIGAALSALFLGRTAARLKVYLLAAVRASKAGRPDRAVPVRH